MYYGLYTTGEVNSQNVRYWSPKSNGNPYALATTNIQGTQKTTVWCGIWGDEIIGPYFFLDTVSGPDYKIMLEDYIWPLIGERWTDQDIWLEDGASAHSWYVDVRSWLTDHFNNKWIGRMNVDDPWPSRSPDLNPCDTFLWGYLKNRVYRAFQKSCN